MTNTAEIIQFSRFQRGTDFLSGKKFEGENTKQYKLLHTKEIKNIAYAMFKPEIEKNGWGDTPEDFIDCLHKMAILSEITGWWDLPPRKMLSGMLACPNFSEVLRDYIAAEELPGDILYRVKANLKAIENENKMFVGADSLHM